MTPSKLALPACFELRSSIPKEATAQAKRVLSLAFSSERMLFIRGKTILVLVSLSGDAVTEAIGATVQTYYLARVELTPQGMQALGQRVVQPGMTAEVLVKTGERSLLAYLLHPLSKRVAASMTEE